MSLQKHLYLLDVLEQGFSFVAYEIEFNCPDLLSQLGSEGLEEGGLDDQNILCQRFVVYIAELLEFSFELVQARLHQLYQMLVDFVRGKRELDVVLSDF